MAHSKVVKLKRKTQEPRASGVRTADAGQAAPGVMGSEANDLVILNLMARGNDGETVARLIEDVFDLNDLQATIMTSQGETWDPFMESGLRLRGDDSPFSKKGLIIARVSASLNRKKLDPGIGPRSIRVRDMVIHPGRNEVFVKGKKITLTCTEFKILLCLARRPGWVFSNGQILESARGFGHSGSDHSLTVYMTALRKKLGHASRYIETVRGVGYRLSTSEST